MARPMYENENDKKNEQRIADYVQKMIGDDFMVSENLGISYILDRAILKNERIVGLMEIKYPKYDFTVNTLPYYHISLNKIKKGIEWSEMTNAPFFLMARFSKEILFAKITKESFKHYPIKWGGWTRGVRDSADLELMAHVPTNEFYTIDQLRPMIIN